MEITDFDIYKNLLKKKSGLVLSSDKSYLLDSRLSPIAKKWGYASINEMTVALQKIPDTALIIDIVEAMTTNETSFFRDTKPFDILKTVVLPYMQEHRAINKTMTTWCAAASSGQEPYSIRMILKELAFKFAGWKTDILATDISNEILDQAREGIYSQFEAQRGLPIQMLMSNFTQIGEKWQINEDIRKSVQYKYFNLLDNMNALGTFDVIFCRNVLIYFDTETKQDILDRMSLHLANDGFLFLGGAETVLGITDKFKPVPDSRGLYAKEGSPIFEKSDSATQAIASGSLSS